MNISKKFFVNEKPYEIILALKDKPKGDYASRISEDSNTTYSHVVKTVDKLEDGGVVNTRKEGRKKMITLTEDGRKLAFLFEQMDNLFGGRGLAIDFDEIDEGKKKQGMLKKLLN